MRELASDTVLAVDDEKSILRLVSVTIGLAGLTPETTQDPNVALEFYRSNAPRIPVVITDRDYKRDDMNGESFAERIRAIATSHQPPLSVWIIMLTGDSLNQADQIRIKNIGVNEIDSKPFSPSVLANKIRQGHNQFQT